ncbi:MAG: ABC transporter ATP-binding protein [Lachnospiraceae bacterium]|nr:ABC transporter ATP-binding protein [Lachnospiraceae bacterium]
MEGALLRIEGLGKTYGKYAALKAVSFSLYPGDIMGIVGANGAGKSTLLSILGMIQKPTAGEVYFKGKRTRESRAEYLSCIGYVPQEIALFEEMSGRENLYFFGKSYGLSKECLKERIAEVCALTEMSTEWLDKPVSTYSGGMKRKVNISAALLHRPELLLLDEPVANLDFETEEQVIGALKRLAESGTTILYVGHQMERMEELCNRFCLLEKGNVLVIGTKEELLFGETEKKTLKQLLREQKGRTPEKE